MIPRAAFDLVVVEIEGGDKYTNDPVDPGGATRWGVTERVARAHGYQGDMKDYPRADAEGVYEASYWTPIQGHKLPFPLALMTFDAAVNMGVDKASRMLQAALRTVQDGKVGDATLRIAIRAAGAKDDLDGALHLFAEERVKLYLTRNNAAEERFERGWINRVLRVLTVCLRSYG